MKVLFIVPYAPNLIRVRPFNLIRELYKLGHEITLGTVWTTDYDRQDITHLSQFIFRVESIYLSKWRSYRNCLLALPSQVPLQAVYSWQPDLIKNLINGDKSNEYDIVHVEHLRGSKYGLSIKSLFPTLPVVWDSVDCISLLFKLASGRSKRRSSKWISAFELKRNEWYEGWLTSQFDHTLVTSSIDKQALTELAYEQGHYNPEISVLPNGVDLEYFSPGDDALRRENTIVVSGKMSYHANVTMVLDFVEKTLPIIWSKRPGVNLWIVGKDPTPEIQALKQINGITVTGTVDDIRPYLQQATVAVAPISYGVGIQNKVLEAMACGTPVVATPQAVSTLAVVNGADVLVADQPEEFAEQVLHLLNDPQYRREIGISGLRYVEAYHKWSTIAGKLEEIYRMVIAESRLTSIN